MNYLCLFPIFSMSFLSQASAQELSTLLVDTKWETPFYSHDGGFSEKERTTFTRSEMILESVIHFSHPWFGTQSHSVKEYFTYAITGIASPEKDLYDLDLVTQKIELTQLNEQSVTSANNTEKCGYKNWILGVPFDFTNIKCFEGADAILSGTRSYTVVEIKPDHLRLGFYMKETPETRDQTLKQYLVFEKLP